MYMVRKIQECKICLFLTANHRNINKKAIFNLSFEIYENFNIQCFIWGHVTENKGQKSKVLRGYIILYSCNFTYNILSL